MVVGLGNVAAGAEVSSGRVREDMTVVWYRSMGLDAHTARPGPSRVSAFIRATWTSSGDLGKEGKEGHLGKG